MAIEQIHVRVIALQTNFIKQIRSIEQVVDTLFITRTDSNKIIYPVSYTCRTVSNIFLTSDFLLLLPHIRFPTDELFSALVMSLRAHITHTLHDNNLVTRTSTHLFKWRRKSVELRSRMRVTTPPKQ